MISQCARRLTPDRHAADDVHARGVLGDDNLGHLLVGATGIVRIRGAAHDDEEVRRMAVGGEPLVAVDHPFVAVGLGAGLDGARIGAGVVRLRHGEARLHPALGQRLQPLLVLLRRAVLDEDLLVAGVGGDHAEQRCGARAVGQHLVHVGVLHEGQPHAAEFRGQVRRPQVRLLDLVLHADAQFAGFLLLLAARPTAVGSMRPELPLVRQNVVVDDLRRGEPDLVDLVVQGRHRLDVHGHGGPS